MRVLVADDHSLFRAGLVGILEAAGFEVVGQVGDGEAAVESARLLRPELVLLDIAMPEMGGLEALRRIRAELPELRVVMLTVSDSDDHLFDAVRAGAHCYLLKDLKADEFVEMLQGLERGEAAITRRTAARIMEGFGNSLSQELPPSPCLTKREMQLLGLVADGSSNKAISQSLSISENTVKYHLKKIFQKLGVQNRTEAVTRALQEGLLDS